MEIYTYVFFYEFFKINFYWSIFALQCCVSFYYTAKWVSYTYTFISSFLDFLPIFFYGFYIFSSYMQAFDGFWVNFSMDIICI